MERSLYERLGAMDSISAVVDDFRDRVARDHRINQKFAKTDMGRLKKMLVDQVCEASGGPCKYTGRTMKEAHAGMSVTSGEFDALVEDLVATLNHFKVGRTEQDELLGILGAPQDRHRGSRFESERNAPPADVPTGVSLDEVERRPFTDSQWYSRV